MRKERQAARRGRIPVVAGSIGLVAVGLGYLLEAIRQRGTCDLGDKSPDTLGLSVVLIVLVGGMTGVIGIAASLAPLRWRRPGGKLFTVGLLLSGLSLVGALAIFLVAGRGPSTWFQHCGT